MAVQRPRVCVVPTEEVLDLAAELASLGGGDIAVGRCWAGATSAADDGAAAAEATQRLDACCPTAPALASALQQQLWPWLRQRYSAAVVLLGAPIGLTARSVAASAAAAAVAKGMAVGLTWQLVTASSVQGPEGECRPPNGAADKKAATAARLRPGGRPAQAAPADEPSPCTVRATTVAEVDKLLAVAADQHAAASKGQQPAALLLHLRVLAAEGLPAAALHVLQPAAEQRPALLRLLEEVAGLHQHRREGEHFLSAAKLSPLNELAAALLAGGKRLFLAADVAGGGGGGGEPDALHVLALLQRLRSIQSVCTKAATRGAPPPTTACDASGWLSADSFLRRLDERQQAEQRRRAEATALAAAEADRRERLRLAAQQLQQRRQLQVDGSGKPLQAPAAESAARAPAPPEQDPQRESPLRHRPDSQPEGVEPHADGASLPGSPAADAAQAGDPDAGSSLDQLRQQFRSLYQQTVGPGGAGSPPQTGPGCPAEGAAAADHTWQPRSGSVALAPREAAPLQAAVNALRARAAQEQAAGGSPAQWAGRALEFSWTGRSPQAGSSLRQQPEPRLAQWAATEGPAARRPAGDVGSDASASQADLPSLADLDAPAASLAALYSGQPVSRLASSGSQRNPWSSPTHGPSCAAGGQQGSWCRAGTGAPDAGSCTPGALPPLWPELTPAAAASHAAEPSQPVSDVFKSENLALGWPQQAPCWRDGSRPLGRYARQPGEGSVGSSSEPPSATSCRPVPQPSCGYAAQRTRATPDCLPFASGGMPAPEQQEQEGAAGWKAGTPAVDSSQQGMPAGAVQAGGVVVAGLLEELQREQRLNATLLQQLHQAQQQLEEASAAAAAAEAAAANPPAPGVEDPADFNGLLAALQLERQQNEVQRRRALLQERQAEEARLALETRLHTQQRQLLAATARCRALEGQSPLPDVFRRYDEDMGRMQACCQRLEQENSQLAQLLAEADLERLAAAVQQLPADAGAVCREQHRKLQQAQQQVLRLQQERAGLQKQLRAAERRDRLAELCRRQAEAGHRAAAELRQQLAAREQQLEAQSLAAAAAAAQAARLEEQLRRAAEEKADLQDAVDGLRGQVALLHGQASRDRVLRCMQLPAMSP